MQTEPKIDIVSAPSSLSISWENRQTRKRWEFQAVFCCLVWIVVAPIAICLALLVVVGFARHHDAGSVLTFLGLLGMASVAWGFTLFLPRQLAQRHWQQSIVVDEQNLTLINRGWLAAKRPKVIPLRSIRAIGVGFRFVSRRNRPLWVSPGTADALQSLELIMRVFAISARACSLASPALKRQAFAAIEGFVVAHKLDIEMVRYETRGYTYP